ncbi:MAG: hypothetical protein AAFO07_33615 [Bacteroidota bacterium]
MEYIRNHYKVPAEIGRRIRFEGKEGVIYKDCGHYIGVNFDEDKPGVIHRLHPTYNVEYLGMGKLRLQTASQLRYQQFKDADWFTGTFAEWLGIKPKNKNQWN